MLWRGAIPGLFAGTVALIGWSWAIFGPTGQYQTAEAVVDSSTGIATMLPSETGSTSMWSEQDFHVVTLLFLGIMLASIVCVLFGAVLHGRYRDPVGVTLMWTASVVLFLGAILSMFSIGMFLLPGAVFSAIAAFLALTSARTPRTPVSQSG